MGIRAAADDGGIYEIPFLDFQYHGPGEPGVLCPGHRGECDHGVDQAAAHDTSDGNSQDDAGEGNHHIRDTHDHRIHDAAEVAGNNPQRGAHTEDDDHQRQHAGQGVSAAVEDTGQHITAQFVRTEEMGRRRSLVRILHHRLQGTVGRNHRRQENNGDEQHHQKRGDAEGPVFLESFPKIFHDYRPPFRSLGSR